MPIKKNIHLDFPNTFSQYADGAWKLDQYQFSKVPKREKLWFKQMYGQSILAYTPEGLVPVYIKVAKLNRDAHVNHLLKCQASGCKFIALVEYDLFGKMHPVCSRCIKKIDCSRRDKGVDGYMKIYFNNDPFGCYSAPEQIQEGIAADLLKPLEKFRLQ